MKLWKVSILLAAAAMISVPANAQDDCATAVAPGTPVTPHLDTTPTWAGSCNSGTSPASLDSWVSFVASDTTMRVRTDIGSSGTDSEFYVSSSSDNTCGGVLTEIACSNDDCFNGANFCPGGFCDHASPWMGNQCISGLTIGDTYYVQVATYGDFPNGSYVVTTEDSGNTCGDGLLACDGSEQCEDDSHCINGQVCNGCVCENACPSSCAGAIDIGTYTNCGAGSAEGATIVNPCCDTDPTGPLADGPDCGGHSSGVNDVWLSFVASDSAMNIRSDVASAGTDSSFNVFSGVCGSLTQIACSEDETGYLGDINILGLTVGETYLVQLGSWADGCADYAITAGGIPGAICGDGTRAAILGEECDPGDGVGGPADDANCEGLCAVDCTCPTPICGNGVQEVGEQCDLGIDPGDPALGETNGPVGCILPDCICTGDCKVATDIVPAVSEWGLVVMVLIGLAAGTVMFGRKRVIA